jgi:hypothetical protein
MAKIKEVKDFVHLLSVEKYFENQELQDKFDEYYRIAIGSINFCKGCSNDISMAIVRLKQYLVNEDETEELVNKRKIMKYTLKDNVRIYSNTMKLMITKHNCTDVIAEKLIAESERHKSLFTINESVVDVQIVDEDLGETISMSAITEETSAKKKGRKKKIETLKAL